MFYETAKNDDGLPRDPFKAIVAPRPIGWITSMSARGEINLAPYSFFNAVSDRPPIVVFILTDNHGAWTLGCYSNRDIRTPNVDRTGPCTITYTAIRPSFPRIEIALRHDVGQATCNNLGRVLPPTRGAHCRPLDPRLAPFCCLKKTMLASREHRAPWPGVARARVQRS